MDAFCIIVLLLNTFVMLANALLYSKIFNHLIETKELVYSSYGFWDKGDNI